MTSDTKDQRAADIQCNLGRVWQRQGKLDKAQLSFQKALEIHPGYAPAYLGWGQVLRDQENVQDAITVFQTGLRSNPNSAELHKALVDDIVTQSGAVAAEAFYQLERQDSHLIEFETSDVLCCTVVRNEVLRLPYFFSYYRQKGIARFLVVDNESTDGTLAYLLAQPDVYVWRSSYSFNQANFGAAWFEVLLRQHGIGHWCLIVDADELLVYDGCEQTSIPALCRDLDDKGKSVFSAVLLDMYSDRAVEDTHYAPCQAFLNVCPYFDRVFYHARYEDAGPYHNQACYVGGMRQRVFGTQGDFVLNKVPLIKYNLDCILMGGQHWTNRRRAQIAVNTGCLLHFKYFSTFPTYVRHEVERREHYDQGVQYIQYAAVLAGKASLTLYDQSCSERFVDSHQLVNLGIINAPIALAQASRESIEFPPIAPLILDDPRPFWSVMITAYTRIEYIAKALRSVLDQAPHPRDMQIEVINDAASPEIRARLEALVQSIGGNRVTFYSHSEHLGHPHIFNLCIQRARGQWVHILHDDDWIEPGFYEALMHGIINVPNVGAAFCRHGRANEVGERVWISPLERDTPGILDNWLDCIAVHCRLQFASIVVKRLAYETVGGFSPHAESAFDWDMWKRLAVRFPVWYEPHILAHFFQGTTSETHRLIRVGEQIAHARRSIEVATSYLPVDQVDELTYRAKQHCAAYALTLSKELRRQGNEQAAIATLQEGMKCHPTYALEQALTSLVVQMESNARVTMLEAQSWRRM